jgi:hypothetical protein
MMEHATTFAGADFAAGAIAALVFGVLIRARIVALTVATALALGALGVALDPRGPGAALDDLAQMVGRLAASGALTGAMLATTTTAFLRSLVKGLTSSTKARDNKKGTR